MGADSSTSSKPIRSLRLVQVPQGFIQLRQTLLHVPHSHPHHVPSAAPRQAPGGRGARDLARAPASLAARRRRSGSRAYTTGTAQSMASPAME